MAAATTHKAEPVPGTLYSAEGINTGLEANESYPSHYPMTGQCSGCDLVIRKEWYAEIGVSGWWQHTKRRWGGS